MTHIAAAALLHKELLQNVLRLKLSFFDVNPIGRLISRFSKDIDIIDQHIPWYILDTIYCIGEVYIYY